MPSPFSQHHHHWKRRWHYYCHILCTKTTEKGDGHWKRWWKLSSFSSSSQTQRKRWWQQVAINFFVATPPQMKAMATSSHFKFSQVLTMEWGQNEVRYVGRREKLWGGEKVEKTKNLRQGRMFLVHPQNNLNGLILNRCTSGYWFTSVYVNQHCSTVAQPFLVANLSLFFLVCFFSIMTSSHVIDLLT